LPDVKNICNPEDGIFTLEVDSFYPENITISWKLTLDSTKEENITHNSSVKSDMYDNGSFRAISTCDLRKNDLIEGKSYGVIATVEHETLDSPIHKSFNMERAMTLPSPVDQKQNQECTTPTMQDNVNLSIQLTVSNPDSQENFWWSIQTPQILEEDCLTLNTPITEEEICTAVDNLNKAAGPDDPMSTYVSAANISLILKKGRTSEDLASYRPISVLNTDYKLLSSIIA
ncbi:uncharacterized protein LOC128644154, partial [Bombina bombina]|uniref:uncharacterized protein LOC128644154 n=1 Tax=Bombina bombina TaxID=8345 RepID=UPI00235AAA9D